MAYNLSCVGGRRGTAFFWGGAGGDPDPDFAVWL